MPYERIKAAKKKAVGSKQTLKAIQKGTAKAVFVARDAEDHVTRPIVDICQAKGIELIWVDSMRKLGAACNIEVGSAAAVILEE
ncbi:MAG: large subunit ribosomal protein [Clostridia bacterium]|nr:large subunit ribosomal protein [Clostridia bacterium]